MYCFAGYLPYVTRYISSHPHGLRVCLTDFDDWMDHFSIWCPNDQRMFISREDFDNFTENQLISFDPWDMYKAFFVQIWRGLYPFTHMTQNNVISLNEWEILTCCEPQTNCSDIWASCFEKCFSQLKIEPKWMRKNCNSQIIYSNNKH